MKIYAIKNWNALYENNRTRELKRMAWVPVPNSHDGDGYTDLVSRKNGAALLGAWLVILQVASRCDPRGTLLRDGGKPHDSESISRMTRLPEPLIKEALEVLSTEIQWIEIQGLTKIPHPPAGFPHLAAEIPHPTAEEQNRTEGNGTEGTEPNRSGGGGDAPSNASSTDGLAEAIYDAYPKKVAKKVAIKAIAIALEKVDGQFLLERTKLFADCRRTADPQFTPHPSTWFNQERYNDDPQTWRRITGGNNAHVDRNAGTLNAENPTDWDAFLRNRKQQGA